MLTKNSFSRTNVTIHTNYNTNTLVCFTWVIDIRRYDHNLNRDKIQKCKCKTPKYMAVKIFASSVGGGGGGGSEPKTMNYKIKLNISRFRII